MKRICRIWLLAAVALALAGCSGFEPGEDAVSVQKKGEIVRYFVDEFVDEADQPYSAEEIQAMMEAELEAYNGKFGTDHIALEKCELEDGVLTIAISCDADRYYEDYCGYYNDDYTTEGKDVEFFAGTIEEAGDYDFQASFLDASGASVEAADVTADAKRKVVILNEPLLVHTSGDILYVSGNVEIVDKREARVQAGDQPQRAYIIYK